MTPLSLAERRKFHIDKSINLGNVLTILILMFTLFGYLRGIYDSVNDIQFKVNLMWADYIQSHKKP